MNSSNDFQYFDQNMNTEHHVYAVDVLVQKIRSKGTHQTWESVDGLIAVQGAVVAISEPTGDSVFFTLQGTLYSLSIKCFLKQCPKVGDIVIVEGNIFLTPDLLLGQSVTVENQSKPERIPPEYYQLNWR